MVPVTIEALPDGGWEVVHRERVADLETACAIFERMAGSLLPTPIKRRKPAEAVERNPVTELAA
jgi:hypothetical protein